MIPHDCPECDEECSCPVGDADVKVCSHCDDDDGEWDEDGEWNYGDRDDDDDEDEDDDDPLW